ncbi:hypothetical protein EC988_002861 [Linderina pennispora]|nr:hypothetical protein EC988_002861 [Linderina pennispora]
MQSVANADVQFAHKRQLQPDSVDRQWDRSTSSLGPGPTRGIASKADGDHRFLPYKPNPNRVSIITTDYLGQTPLPTAVPSSESDGGSDGDKAISCPDNDYPCHKKVMEVPSFYETSSTSTTDAGAYPMYLASTPSSNLRGGLGPISPAPSYDSNNRRTLPLKIAIPGVAIIIIALFVAWFLRRRRRRRIALVQQHVDDGNDSNESAFDSTDQPPLPFSRRWQRRGPEMLQVTRQTNHTDASISPVEAAHTASRWSTQTSIASSAPLLTAHSLNEVPSPPPVRQTRGLSMYSDLPHEELPPYIDPLIEAMGRGENSAGRANRRSVVTRSMLVSPPPYQAIETPPVTPISPTGTPMH